MLIQHNPNEGLKQPPGALLFCGCVGAHSAQPERGIETNVKAADEEIDAWCSFSTTRTRD